MVCSFVDAIQLFDEEVLQTMIYLPRQAFPKMPQANLFRE